MTRKVRVIVTSLVLLLIIGAGVMWFDGCGSVTPRTRIAQRKLYQGPSNFTADKDGWPHWRGPSGDGISRETNLADTWPSGGPPQLWSADVGIGYSSPIASAGRVYLFSMNESVETLTCFDANTGQIVWSKEGGQGRTHSYPGTRTTPSIEGNNIITLGGLGELICRDVKNGEPSWTVNILSATNTTPLDWGTASTPLVHGDLIYMQTGQGGPVAVAVNRADGKVAWTSEAKAIAGYAAPILADVEGSPQLIIFGGKAVYGMDPTSGKTIWQHTWSTSWDVNASTPVYRDGKLFLTSGYGSGAVMLQISKGSPPKELWQSKQAQSRFQPATLDGEAIYVNSEGTFTCLGWNDGKLLWKGDSNQLKLGLGGSMVRLPGERMLTLGERGKLSLSKMTPKGMNYVSGFTAVEGTQVWSTPLIYGGRVYVKGEKELVCYDISNGSSNATTQQAALSR
jgi:outer membrane protein assembly factor BamB